MSDLPAGWRRTTLGEVADCSLGKMLDRGRHRGHELVPYLRNANVQWDRFDLDSVASMELAPGEIDRYSVRAGDLLVCEGGEIGRAAVWPEGSSPIAYQKALHRVRSRGDVNLKYVRYLFEWHAQTGVLLEHATGSTIKHLPQQQLKLVPVPLAPLMEQRQIVDALEDHLSRLDAAAAYLSANAGRLRNLQASALAGEPTIAHAEHRPLSSVISEGLSNGRSVPTRAGGFPVLRLTALNDGRIDVSRRKPGDWSADEAAPFIVRQGDFLASRGNGSLKLVGRGGLVEEVPDPVAFPDTMIRVKPDPSVISAEYLRLLWNSPIVRRQIESMARTTAGIYKINQKQLGAVVLPVASLREQESLVLRMDEVGTAARSMRTGLGAARVRGVALRCALLTAAFSGRLTGRSTDTEVVEEIANSQGALW